MFKNKEFENICISMIVLKLYNFIVFFYFVNFVLGVGLVYIICGYKYCFFMYLYIFRVISKIFIFFLYIFNFLFMFFFMR